MKLNTLSLWTLFVLSLFGKNLHAQDEIIIKPGADGIYIYQEVIDTDHNVNDNHTLVKSFIALAYRSAQDVIQYDQTDQMIVKGNFRNKYTFYEERVDHTLIIDIKDNKIRITFTNFVGQFGTSQNRYRYEQDSNPFGFPKNKALTKSSASILSIIDLLKTHLKSKTKEDW